MQNAASRPGVSSASVCITSIGTARAMSEQRRGKITVAASPLMASLLLPEAIAEFHALYPKINVVLRDAPYDKIRQLVLDGSAEIGFGRVPDDTNPTTYQMWRSQVHPADLADRRRRRRTERRCS